MPWHASRGILSFMFWEVYHKQALSLDIWRVDLLARFCFDSTFFPLSARFCWCHIFLPFFCFFCDHRLLWPHHIPVDSLFSTNSLLCQITIYHSDCEGDPYDGAICPSPLACAVRTLARWVLESQNIVSNSLLPFLSPTPLFRPYGPFFSSLGCRWHQSMKILWFKLGGRWHILIKWLANLPCEGWTVNLGNLGCAHSGVVYEGHGVISASTFAIHFRVYSLPVFDWSHASGQTAIQQQLNPFELDEWLLMVSLRKRLISTVLHIRCPVCRHPSFTQSALLNSFAYTLPWWYSTNTIIPISLSPYWPLSKFCSFKSLLVDELGCSAQAGGYHVYLGTKPSSTPKTKPNILIRNRKHYLMCIIQVVFKFVYPLYLRAIYLKPLSSLFLPVYLVVGQCIFSFLSGYEIGIHPFSLDSWVMTSRKSRDSCCIHGYLFLSIVQRMEHEAELWWQFQTEIWPGQSQV